MTVAVSPQAVLSESTIHPVMRQGPMGQPSSHRLPRVYSSLFSAATEHRTKEECMRG